MHAYAKSEFADAYTCTDIASLDIKWMNEYNLHKIYSNSKKSRNRLMALCMKALT